MDDADQIAMGLCYLGSAVGERGDAARASALLDEGIALLRERGNRYRLGYALYMGGFAAQARADHPAALAHFAESLTVFRDAGNQLGYAQLFEGMAPSLLALGQAVVATRLLGAAAGLREALGTPLPPGEAP